MTPTGMQSAICILPSEELYALLIERAGKEERSPSVLALELVQVGLECQRMHRDVPFGECRMGTLPGSDYCREHDGLAPVWPQSEVIS